MVNHEKVLVSVCSSYVSSANQQLTWVLDNGSASSGNLDISCTLVMYRQGLLCLFVSYAVSASDQLIDKIYLLQECKRTTPKVTACKKSYVEVSWK